MTSQDPEFDSLPEAEQVAILSDEIATMTAKAAADAARVRSETAAEEAQWRDRLHERAAEQATADAVASIAQAQAAVETLSPDAPFEDRLTVEHGLDVAELDGLRPRLAKAEATKANAYRLARDPAHRAVSGAPQPTAAELKAVDEAVAKLQKLVTSREENIARRISMIRSLGARRQENADRDAAERRRQAETAASARSETERLYGWSARNKRIYGR